ncbi:hypothetical protein DJ568_03185 [Mucilaginibacter hurinus]|uniref:Uncharacterized protein n=1 Tax=Mucilaginibacter hurinus TaxID=2201324 RepID=A0A367GW16_9SPHI|nr:hypothetical protein [Mucilaginibacter hurinus]RCH56873.1 hypothetical protein DJ568_03185 [Mucilaginibacter hurinus]
MANDFLNLFIRNFNKLDPKDRLDYHREHPDMTFVAYKKQKLSEITEAVLPLKKIYLDTKFWIEIRDALHGIGQPKPLVKEIFFSLKKKVAEQKVICPFSTALFDELLKQGDRVKRKNTAQVADILTGNYMLSPLYYLIGCETYNFIAMASGRGARQTDYTWTKALSALGDISFNIARKDYPEADKLVLQKSFLDFYYQHTFQEVTAFNDDFQESSGSAVWHAGMLNTYKEAYSTNMSLEALQRKELFSTFSHAANSMNLSLHNVDLELQIARMGLEQIRTAAPFSFCYTGIYAALSRDKSRLNKPNDYYDISHASLAVGGCDYFFVEKSFSTMLKGLKFDQRFKVKIASDHAEILALVNDI